MAKKTGNVEWVGGRFSSPMVVGGGGDGPYRPEISLWAELEGPIVGMELTPPGERFAPTLALLAKSMKKPLAGPPRLPARVRVADAELAQLLRTTYGAQLEIVVGPTPELDEILASFGDNVGTRSVEDVSWLELEGVTPDVLASFHRAAARWYRAAPWKLFRDDDDVVTVTIEALGIRDSVVSILGNLGAVFGLLVFRNRAEFERFIEEAEHTQRTGSAPELPPQLALTFEPAADLPGRRREERSAHGWEVAGEHAFPNVTPLRGTVKREPTRRDFVLLEALANAFADLAESEPTFGDARARGDGLESDLYVNAGGRSVRVRLSIAPRPAEHEPRPGVFDLRAMKRDPEGLIDEDWAAAFESDVLARFEASPEAAALGQKPDWVGLVLRYGRIQLDVGVGGIGASQLRGILFELFPRHVACKPEEAAPEIIEESRAFWTWARREHGLETADECLAVLRPGAEATLARGLADPTKYGTGKSMFLSGEAAGYDMRSESGQIEWLRVLDTQKDTAAPRKTDPKDKAKRKMQKASRRRNR